jgi:fatty-acid desaturase
MRSATLLKMFVVLPALPFLVVYTLFGVEQWWVVVLGGILLYYPIQQLGQAIGYHKLFAHKRLGLESFTRTCLLLLGQLLFMAIL